ncbi:hypothetical protein EYF80_060457 [Liparis tanakae]|uniref:Uncharacterized protein n=1 Tax=Liparis tanakae TaxID=230148 RepID=A0A4Z2EKK0_9TELE|nr:hypothetical protein EYF80_060457 [Liparis tanakae]
MCVCVCVCVCVISQIRNLYQKKGFGDVGVTQMAPLALHTARKTPRGGGIIGGLGAKADKGTLNSPRMDSTEAASWVVKATKHRTSSNAVISGPLNSSRWEREEHTKKEATGLLLR